MAGLLRGCAVLPRELEDQVFRVLRASEEAAPAELAALRSRLEAAGATAEDIAHVESGIRNSRRVGRMDLATLQGLDDAGRALIEGLDLTGWRRVFGYGYGRLRMFRNPELRALAIRTLKGILGEELFYTSRAFREAMARARARAIWMGYPPENLRFVKGARGITLSERQIGYLNHGELTDGLIIATRNANLTEAQLAQRLAEREGRQFTWGVGRRGVASPPNEDLHLLAVVESKSPSNLEQIAVDHGGNWLGQMDNDIERFTQVPSIINGRWYTPRQVTVSRYRTEWLAVVPKGRRIPDELLERLGFGGPGRQRLFQQIEQELADGVLNNIAERALQTLSSP